MTASRGAESSERSAKREHAAWTIMYGGGTRHRGLPIDRLIAAAESQLFDAVAAHHRWWQEAHRDENVYGYGFFTPPCVEWAGAVVFSEEGLQQVTDEYTKNPRYANEWRRELTRLLRWSPADSPYCMLQHEAFESVNHTLAAISKATHALDPYDPCFRQHIDSLYGVLIRVLGRFRGEVLREKNPPLLSVWFGDQSEEDIAFFVRNCNDPSVAKRYFDTVAE